MSAPKPDELEQQLRKLAKDIRHNWVAYSVHDARWDEGQRREEKLLADFQALLATQRQEAEKKGMWKAFRLLQNQPTPSLKTLIEENLKELER